MLNLRLVDHQEAARVIVPVEFGESLTRAAFKYGIPDQESAQEPNFEGRPVVGPNPNIFLDKANVSISLAANRDPVIALIVGYLDELRNTTKPISETISELEITALALTRRTRQMSLGFRLEKEPLGWARNISSWMLQEFTANDGPKPTEQDQNTPLFDNPVQLLGPDPLTVQSHLQQLNDYLVPTVGVAEYKKAS